MEGFNENQCSLCHRCPPDKHSMSNSKMKQYNFYQPWGFRPQWLQGRQTVRIGGTASGLKSMLIVLHHPKDRCLTVLSPLRCCTVTRSWQPLRWDPRARRFQTQTPLTQALVLAETIQPFATPSSVLLSVPCLGAFSSSRHIQLIGDVLLRIHTLQVSPRSRSLLGPPPLPRPPHALLAPSVYVFPKTWLVPRVWLPA